MQTAITANTRVLFQPEIVAMGGAERSLLALGTWLHEQRIDACVVTYMDHVGLETFASFPLKVVQLKPHMSAAKKVRAFRKFFCTLSASNRPLLSGYQGALHAALANIRATHCLMHDTPDLFEDPAKLTAKEKVRRSVSNAVVGHNLRSGGQTIVTSEHLKAECRKLFRVNAAIARMGGLYSASEFHPRRVTSELRLLSVSRIEPNKRIDWILRALAALENGAAPLSSRIDWSLDIVGNGAQLIELQELTRALAIGDRVRFRGRLSDADLQRAYADAHLFLMPAVQGYGIPAVESLARGLPVLLHRDSGVSDILLETPWATVIEGNEQAMLPGLRRAVDAVIEGRHVLAPLPPLPSEAAWSERVATLCGWVG